MKMLRFLSGGRGGGSSPWGCPPLCPPADGWPWRPESTCGHVRHVVWMSHTSHHCQSNNVFVCHSLPTEPKEAIIDLSAAGLFISVTRIKWMNRHLQQFDAGSRIKVTLTRPESSSVLCRWLSCCVQCSDEVWSWWASRWCESSRTRWDAREAPGDSSNADVSK